MRILPLLCAAALLSPVAKADKFWLSDPAAETVEGSLADVIQGVLLAEDDAGYHIRVVGGELILPKGRVFKIEKDDLTIEAIVAAEQQERERLAADAERRALARAAERLRRDVRAAEAAASRRTAQAAEASMPAPAPAFDPVIGRVDPATALSQQELMQELQVAWTLTKDRRYLKALRQLRRLN